MLCAPYWLFYGIQRLLTLAILNSLVYLGSCFNVEGTIYGKFESGYLVSVQVGSEVLNGVLYHPEEQAPSSNAIVPKKRGRRSTKKIKDPNLPKPKWSGYTFYYVEKLPMFRSLYPTKRREFTKMIVESWRNLSRQEKRVTTLKFNHFVFCNVKIHRILRMIN